MKVNLNRVWLGFDMEPAPVTTRGTQTQAGQRANAISARANGPGQPAENPEGLKARTMIMLNCRSQDTVMRLTYGAGLQPLRFRSVRTWPVGPGSGLLIPRKWGGTKGLEKQL
jgi:hypothetical protein